MKELLLKNKDKLDAEKLIKKYLDSREDVYDWSIIESVTATGITRIKAEVTSLTWQGVVWKHYVLLYVPTTINFNNIYTLIDGGRLTGGVPDQIDENSPLYGPFLSILRGFSAATGMIMAVIRNIPNTPILGNSTEDEFVFTSVQKYLATRDTNWSPFNPMIKGVMQCFTAIQQIVAQEKGVNLVRGYCAAGLSKRGWTAYLAGAYDSRCNALVPVVQDNINISESYRRRRDVYGEDDVKLPQSELFEYMGMLEGNLKPLGREILEVVDPYAFRDKLTIPMYIITSTNDENFTIDSATYYIKGFENAQLAYQRNLGHDIDPQYLMASIYWYLKLNLGQATPKITWTRNMDEDNLTFTITATQTGWSQVNVISATSATENFLAANFTTTSTSVSGTTFDVVIPRDSTNFKASYVEVVYNTPTGLPAPYNTIRFAVCTEAVMTPSLVPTYDPDFQAWIDYNIAQGHYITSDTTKLDAANQYVLDSKADGTWDGKDVFHLFTWNDLQMDDASLVCLKRLVKADVYGGCTYTLEGWEGNGVDGYIDSLFTYSIDGVNYTKDDAGRGICVYKIQSKGFGELFGIRTQAGYMVMYNSSQVGQRINTAYNLNTSADLTGIGLKTQYRDDNTNVRLYNKSSEMIRTQNSSNDGSNVSLCLFQRNNQHFSNVGASAFFLSKSFTQTENESIRTNLNTYLSSIGLTPIA